MPVSPTQWHVYPSCDIALSKHFGQFDTEDAVLQVNVDNIQATLQELSTEISGEYELFYEVKDPANITSARGRSDLSGCAYRLDEDGKSIRGRKHHASLHAEVGLDDNQLSIIGALSQQSSVDELHHVDGDVEATSIHELQHIVDFNNTDLMKQHHTFVRGYLGSALVAYLASAGALTYGIAKTSEELSGATPMPEAPVTWVLALGALKLLVDGLRSSAPRIQDVLEQETPLEKRAYAAESLARLNCSPHISVLLKRARDHEYI